MAFPEAENTPNNGFWLTRDNLFFSDLSTVLGDL